MMGRASVVALVTLVAGAAEAITYEGYAADTVCTNGFINTVDGTNVTAAAPTHSVTCMLLDYCIDSGYTLLEKIGDNYIGKYQLDAAGVLLMVTALEGLRDRNVVNNVMFRIEGTVSMAARGTGAHDGDTLASSFRDRATYRGLPLGVIFETTSVTALEPGPALAYPLLTTQVPPTEEDKEAVAGTAIGVIVGVVLVAWVAMIVFERKGSASAPDKQDVLVRQRTTF